MVYVPYIITEIQNGRQSATLSRINCKTEWVLPARVVHNPTRFHENRFKTFRVILYTDKQMDGQTDRHWQRQYIAGDTV